MMMPKDPTIIELDMNDLKDLLKRAEASLEKKDYQTIKAVVDCATPSRGICPASWRRW
jgi:hypothetical protein